jgi:hypothetical protein
VDAYNRSPHTWRPGTCAGRRSTGCRLWGRGPGRICREGLVSMPIPSSSYSGGIPPKWYSPRRRNVGGGSGLDVKRPGTEVAVGLAGVTGPGTDVIVWAAEVAGRGPHVVVEPPDVRVGRADAWVAGRRPTVNQARGPAATTGVTATRQTAPERSADAPAAVGHARVGSQDGAGEPQGLTVRVAHGSVDAPDASGQTPNGRAWPTPTTGRVPDAIADPTGAFVGTPAWRAAGQQGPGTSRVHALYKYNTPDSNP